MKQHPRSSAFRCDEHARRCLGRRVSGTGQPSRVHRGALVAVIAAHLVALSQACAPARVAPPPTRVAARGCSAEQRLHAGGEFATARDGVPIWFKLNGKADAPTLAFVHGGPGYNSFTFEQSSGRLLEKSFHVLYFDQRGCGRSGFVGAAEQYGMSPTVDDLEMLRARAGVERLILIGHSFGGAVAAAYAHRYPEHVAAVVMVDTAPDLGRALTHQVATLDRLADSAFPAQAASVHAIAQSSDAPFPKLARIYGLIGRLPLQRRLHFATEAAQHQMEELDAASALTACTSPAVVSAYEREGYLSGAGPDVGARIMAPTLLIAGRYSEVIGKDTIQAAAQAWGATVEWMDTGHFVYFERPDEFVSAVEAFTRGAGR